MKLIPYLRVSTDGQADNGTGLDVQLDGIRKWAKTNGHTLTKPCREEGVSGAKDLDARPALLEAMLALKARNAAGIVVYRLDRLARDLILQEQLLSEVRRLGGDLFSTSEAENGVLVYDEGDPSRALIRHVLGAVAQYERSMIVLRLRSARELKARKGGYAGYGPPPFGQRSRGGELVVDAQEQQAIDRIVSLRSEGASLPQIAQTLAEEGITSKRGGAWYPTSIQRVLARQEANTPV